MLPPSSTQSPAPRVHWWQALLLGTVQGATEFVPVSSSAHLNIAHHLLGQKTRQLPFDVVLSVGTIGALGWYYRRDWKAMVREKEQRRLLFLVGLACVPAVLVAALSPIRKWEDSSKLFYSPFYNGLWMMLGGALLLGADRYGSQTRDVADLKAQDALWIGASQALALVPGFSRSGSTLATGLLLGLRREEAARFSFLLSLPISVGAVLYELRRFKPHSLGAGSGEAALGVASSGVSGFYAISFLLRALHKRDVTPFVAWRAVVGLFAMVWFWKQK